MRPYASVIVTYKVRAARAAGGDLHAVPVRTRLVAWVRRKLHKVQCTMADEILGEGQP